MASTDITQRTMYERIDLTGTADRGRRGQEGVADRRAQRDRSP